MKERKSIRTSISSNKDQSSDEQRPTSRRITQRVSSESERTEPSDSEPVSAVPKPTADEPERDPRLKRPDAEPVDSPDPFRSADLLLDVIGEDAVRPLAENPRYQITTPEIAPGEESHDPEIPEPRQWLANLMRAYLTREGMAHLQGHLQAALAEPQRLGEQLAELQGRWDEMEASYQNKLQEAERELSDVNVQQKRMREQLQRSVPVRELADSVFSETGAEGAILEMLREALQEPSEALGPFVGGVCLGWTELRLLLEQSEGGEEQRMEAVEKALRRFMGHVAGHLVPERREVLKRVGQAVNAYFEEYDFVSPEDWRHIDPAVHNASGVGGQSVKAGLGYVVLRRGTGQTVVYADIVTE